MKNKKINIGQITREATSEAFQKARLTNIPVIIKEGNQIIELFPNGEKKILQTLSSNRKKLSKHFRIA